MLSVDEILQATGGELIQRSGKTRCRDIVINSRLIKNGDAFIAIIGNRLNGHKFVPLAVKSGAGTVVVSEAVKVPAGVNVIRVSDTTKALGLCAAFYRRKFSIPLIAVTGSAGKTTTKELIAAVLGTELKVLKNELTLNNHIGVPLTLFKLRPAHDAAVLELGTNQPGDIDWLGAIARPDIAVFTNIGESHLQKLKNKAGVYREKSGMVKYLPPDGKIIFNADDPYLRRLRQRQLTQKLMGYGLSDKADVRARNIIRGKSISFTVRGKAYEVGAIAMHQVHNALAAICCAQALGIKFNNICSALKKTAKISGRMEIKRFGGVSVIDDTYNANPSSFKAAVESLAAYPCRGRKFLVCADMLELGEQAVALHGECGRFAARHKIDFILGVGSHAERLIGEAARANGCVDVRHFASRGKLHGYIRQKIRPRDLVMVKGSRSMFMEKTVDYLSALKI